MAFRFAVVGVITTGVRKNEKSEGKCDSPLERGGGVCSASSTYANVQRGPMA